MVAAFEQSLSSMTSRLQQLSATAEMKDSELDRLRNTIENYKKQGSAVDQINTSPLKQTSNNVNRVKTASLIRRHTFNTTANNDGKGDG
jgi:neuron navigator 2